jgi:hypothetical protein
MRFVQDAPVREPLATECSNAGHDDRWTTPCCYVELGDVGRGEHECPECGRTVYCFLETQPVCVTSLEQ